jgi:hypothetical protein
MDTEKGLEYQLNDRRRGRSLSILLALFLFSASTLRAQEVPGLVPVSTIPGDGSVLGEISDMDFLPDGKLLIMDGQARQLFVFSPSGELVRTLGREGSGPGEFRAATEVEVTPEGFIVVLDPGNVRFSSWTAEGELLDSHPLRGVMEVGRAWPAEFYWSHRGPVIKTLGFREGHPLAFLLLKEDLSGVRDTLARVEDSPAGATGRFSPFALTPEGQVLAARGDTLYSLSVLSGPRKSRRTYSRADLPAERRTPSDREELLSAMGRIRIPEGIEVPRMEIPEFLPRFRSRSFDFDSQGRLWTCPTVPANAPSVFDVFAGDGSFLGSVPLPEHVNGFRIRWDRILVRTTTEMGEPIVRVYQIR